MILEKIMSQNVVTVGLDDSLCVIKEIFDQGKIHHLLVEEEKQLHGVIFDRDLWQTIRIFNRHRISCIQIVTSAQHIVGIITWRDIFRLLGADREALSWVAD